MLRVTSKFLLSWSWSAVNGGGGGDVGNEETSKKSGFGTMKCWRARSSLAACICEQQRHFPPTASRNRNLPSDQRLENSMARVQSCVDVVYTNIFSIFVASSSPHHSIFYTVIVQLSRRERLSPDLRHSPSGVRILYLAHRISIIPHFGR